MTTIALWEPEEKFLIKAIRAFLIMSTNKKDHETAEIILIKLGEQDENQNNKQR